MPGKTHNVAGELGKHCSTQHSQGRMDQGIKLKLKGIFLSPLSTFLDIEYRDEM